MILKLVFYYYLKILTTLIIGCSWYDKSWVLLSWEAVAPGGQLALLSVDHWAGKIKEAKSDRNLYLQLLCKIGKILKVKDELWCFILNFKLYCQSWACLSVLKYKSEYIYVNYHHNQPISMNTLFCTKWEHILLYECNQFSPKQNIVFQALMTNWMLLTDLLTDYCFMNFLSVLQVNLSF